MDWIDNNLPGNAVDCAFLSDENIDRIIDFRIFPNPFSNRFFIEINGLNTKNDVQLFIYDIYGKKLFSQEFNASHQLIVDNSNFPIISSLSKGVYFVSVVIDGNINTQKLIKQ